MMKFFLLTFFFFCSFSLFFAIDIKNLKSPESESVTILKDQDNFNIRCFLYNDLNVYDLGGLSRPFKNKE